MTRWAKLALEDGSVYSGQAFGAEGEAEGEVCFNTSMTGYQEILTDPSYFGQMVALTYPEIGNYGVNADDVESCGIHLSGLIVRHLSGTDSNFRSDCSLDDYLKRFGKIGIQGIDTRALVRRIRTQGAMNGVLSTVDLNDESLIAKAKQAPGLVGRDLVKEVLQKTDNIDCWDEPLSNWSDLSPKPEHREVSSITGCTCADPHAADSPLIVAVDYGMKWNIARHLFDMGCRVRIVPGSEVTAETILMYRPDGVFLSNGPGDPQPLIYAQRMIQGLLGKVPIFGICLGHQLLSLACGAKTYKLKFGHRGANQPVLNLQTGKVEITSQNHGFGVDESSLPDDLEITHRNLNDETIEGIQHKRFPAFSVQYHPEASAGPHDSAYLFRQFRDMILKNRENSGLSVAVN